MVYRVGSWEFDKWGHIHLRKALIEFQVEAIWYFRMHNTSISSHYRTLEPGSKYRYYSSGQWKHGDFKCNQQLDCAGMQVNSDLLSLGRVSVILNLSRPFRWERTKYVGVERVWRHPKRVSTSLAARLSAGSTWMVLSLFLAVIFESLLLAHSVWRVRRPKFDFLQNIMSFSLKNI